MGDITKQSDNEDMDPTSCHYSDGYLQSSY